MYDDVEEITKLVKDREGDMEALRNQMQSDYELWALEEMPEDEVKKGYEKYKSSAPRNYADKIIHGVNRAQMTIQIKLPEDASEKERRAASVGEMYLFGALQAIDRRLELIGEPPLREGLDFFIALRGWYALKALVFVPKGEKNTIFDAQPWDPMHVTWDIGSKGVLWSCHKRMATKAQIFSELGIEIRGGKGKQNQTEVMDWWDVDRNAVIIEGTFAKEPTHVPVNIGPVGSSPTIQGKDYSPYMQYQGDSVYAAARKLYGPINKTVARLMDMMDRSVVGSVVHGSKGGQKSLEGDPFKVWQEIRVDTDDGEFVKPLELPKAPPEAAAVLQTMNNDLEQSTLPTPWAYGGITEEISGRAMAMMTDATRSNYSPRTSALSRAYRWLCEELLSQYAMKGVKPVELSGFKENGEFFQVKTKHKDINKSWFVSVKVEPKMPRDEEKEIMMAKAATTPTVPGGEYMVSMQTAREDYLKLRDPDAERDKVLAEMGETLPPIMMANIAKALQDRGQPEMAQQVLALLGPAGGGQGAPGANGAAPPGQQNGQQEPPQVQVVRQVLQVLQEIGAGQLAQALVQALQSPQGPPPQLIEDIVQALVQAGQQELARAFLEVLQTGPGPTPQQAGPPPTEGQRLAQAGLVGPRG
jgi:hypothetical protein